MAELQQSCRSQVLFKEAVEEVFIILLVIYEVYFCHRGFIVLLKIMHSKITGKTNVCQRMHSVGSNSK